MIHLARAAHVLGVVWWIGGVAVVTATLLPLLVRRDLSEPERLAVFRQIRRRFAWQARGAVLLVAQRTLTCWPGSAVLPGLTGRPAGGST